MAKRGRQPNLTDEDVKKIVRKCKKRFINERNTLLDKKS